MEIINLITDKLKLLINLNRAVFTKVKVFKVENPKKIKDKTCL